MLSERIVAEIKSYPMQYRIKRLRCSLGLSQKDFARRIGFTQTTVCKWERQGVLPSDLAFEAIIKEFDLPLDFFIDAEIDKIKFK